MDLMGGFDEVVYCYNFGSLIPRALFSHDVTDVNSKIIL